MGRTCIYRQATEQGQIQVWQEDQRRSLWFDDVVLQSEIDLDDPAVLPNPVNRAMLVHLMFGQQPQRVLLAGCGGGAIARWFVARSPMTGGDAVEVSQPVASVAREFFGFPGKDSGWQLHLSDVRDFIRGKADCYDFILVDLEENQYSPEWISSNVFLECCRDALTPAGVVTLNLIPNGPNHCARALTNIRAVFERKTLCLPVENHDNQLIIAFRQRPNLDDIDNRIEQAARQWGLPFRKFWQALQSSNRTGSGVL